MKRFRPQARVQQRSQKLIWTVFVAGQFESGAEGQRSTAKAIRAIRAAAPAPSSAHSHHANWGSRIGGAQYVGIPPGGHSPPLTTQKCASQVPTQIPTPTATATSTIAMLRLTQPHYRYTARKSTSPRLAEVIAHSGGPATTATGDH